MKCGYNKSRFVILIISSILPFHNRQVRGDADCVVSRNDLHPVTLINGKMPGEVDCNSIADLNSGDGKCRPDHYDPILKRDIYGSRVSAKQRLLCRRAVSPQTDKLPVFAIGKKTARGKQTIHHKYKRWDRKLNTGSKKNNKPNRVLRLQERTAAERPAHA